MDAVTAKNVLSKLSIAPKDPATKYRVAFNFMFVLPLLISIYVGVNYIMKVEMPNSQVYGLIGLGIAMSVVGLYLSYNTSVKEVIVEEGDAKVTQASNPEETPSEGKEIKE